MSFAKIVQTSDGDDVIVMRSRNNRKEWAVSITLLRPDKLTHTHEMGLEGEEGEALSEQLFNEIGSGNADAVKQGMLQAVASGA